MNPEFRIQESKRGEITGNGPDVSPCHQFWAHAPVCVESEFRFQYECFDTTCGMTPLLNFALVDFCPPFAAGVRPCVADGKRGGINYYHHESYNGIAGIIISAALDGRRDTGGGPDCGTGAITDHGDVGRAARAGSAEI